jgi:hypothetical protein
MPERLMNESDIEIVVSEGHSQHKGDDGQRFRIHIAHPTVGNLGQDLGWWKSEKRAAHERQELIRILREWGFMR